MPNTTLNVGVCAHIAVKRREDSGSCMNRRESGCRETSLSMLFAVAKVTQLEEKHPRKPLCLACWNRKTRKVSECYPKGTLSYQWGHIFCVIPTFTGGHNLIQRKQCFKKKLQITAMDTLLLPAPNPLHTLTYLLCFLQEDNTKKGKKSVRRKQEHKLLFEIRGCLLCFSFFLYSLDSSQLVQVFLISPNGPAHISFMQWKVPSILLMESKRKFRGLKIHFNRQFNMNMNIKYCNK